MPFCGDWSLLGAQALFAGLSAPALMQMFTLEQRKETLSLKSGLRVREKIQYSSEGCDLLLK